MYLVLSVGSAICKNVYLSVIFFLLVECFYDEQVAFFTIIKLTFHKRKINKMRKIFVTYVTSNSPYKAT